MSVCVFRQCCSDSPWLNSIARHRCQQCSSASLTVTYVHRWRHLTRITSTGLRSCSSFLYLKVIVVARSFGLWL